MHLTSACGGILAKQAVRHCGKARHLAGSLAAAPRSLGTTLVPALELNAAGRPAAPQDARGDRVSERPQEASPSEAGGVVFIEAMGQERGDEHCRRAST